MWRWLKDLLGESSNGQSEKVFPSGKPTPATERYFQLSGEIESGKRDGDFARAIRAARDTYPILAKFVTECVRDYGKFDIHSSHAIHTAGSLMAVMGDREALSELHQAVEKIPEIQDWLVAAEQAERDADAVDQILAVVQQYPGTLQNQLKKRIAIIDARRLSTLAGWLDRGGRIRRVRTANTYRLNLVTDASQSSAVPTALEEVPLPVKSSARHQRRARKAKKIDLGRVPLVRLPMPTTFVDKREAVGSKKAKTKVEVKQPLFVVEGSGWKLHSEERLSSGERPDRYYKDVHRTARHTYWVDPKGRRDGFEDAGAVVQVTDPSGVKKAERGLPYDIYRTDVNTHGTAILFLSRKGILHGYTETLESFLVEHLEELSEYVACSERLGITSHELKSHVRCVAIGDELDRYLYTVVDEAWCAHRNGQVVWGVQMPTREGWTRVASRSSRAGTSAEALSALEVMGMTLPVTPKEITRRYRKLALEWHPDRNPENPDAKVRMQQLNAAVDLLTGMDFSALSAEEISQVTYERVINRQIVKVGETETEITFTMGMSEKSAADWIYAANFGGQGNRAYLASYGGKVVKISEGGDPIIVYDIGAVPRFISDAGDFTYILTDSILYVLAEDRLHALVDIVDKGDLMIGNTGFALQESKRWAWYMTDGSLVGAVTARDPIRRVRNTAQGLIVETRRHRAVVSGPPEWW